MVPSGASDSPGDHGRRLQTRIHDDAAPLKVLLSVSARERASLSMGEETVQSIRVCRESMATGPCAGGATSVGGSRGAGSTICVTGRIVGLCAAVPSASMTTGLKASRMDFCPASVQGRGGGEGETLGLGGVGERGGLLLIQGGAGSNSGVMGESVTGSKGECGAGAGGAGSTLDSVGGQELADGSMERSAPGTGGGVGGGRGLSCIDRAPGSAKLALRSSCEDWGDSREMLRGSTGSGDSNTELGRGSRVGVVEISRAAGAGTQEESPFVAVESPSFTWGAAERGNDLTEPPSAAGGSSAKSGSVTSGASWEEAEDRGRSLLACMTPSSVGAVAGMLDKDEAERPLASLGSSSLGCT